MILYIYFVKSTFDICCMYYNIIITDILEDFFHFTLLVESITSEEQTNLQHND